MPYKVIQECLVYLNETNEAFKEWDINDSFIEKKDEIVIKNLLEVHSSKWTSKMYFNSWTYLNKYKDFLIDLDFDISNLEKPDCFIKEFDCSDTGISINDKRIIIEEFNRGFFNNLKYIDDISFLDLNLKNIFKLYNLINENKIKINLEVLHKINLYINTIKDSDYCNLFDSDILDKKLHPFQEAGVLFLLFNKRAILGDEMGLGKTIQSLSAIILSGSTPSLIVSPSSLKYNWLTESISLKNGIKSVLINNSKSFQEEADFYIINYESLHNYIDLIKNKNFKSIIMDESHYIKNKNAKRTKNIFQIINNINYRFALTGTCIMNNPKDLISQLKTLNQLDHFGNEEKFIELFCNPTRTKWGTDKNGASNIDLLARKLREICFLRRTKKEVLKELPDKVISLIPLDLIDKNGYKLLLKNFSKLKKVEKIGHIEKLRKFVVKDKLLTIEKWINNFLTSGEKLVVFAHHKFVQEELIKKYPNAARILSSDSEEVRERNKEFFQNDKNCNLIICSLKSASLGFTLTAASNVLFVEMDWCSAINKQAEDRCHRIGQKDSVNAWYFIVKNTIEEHIWKVSKEKEELTNKIYNDQNKDLLIEEYSSSILNEIIELIEMEEKDYYKEI